MEEFNSFVSTLDRLLAPDGCPWDREQTLQSLRHTLLEETYEVIEAIDVNDNLQLEEELGDLFFNILFLCKVAEKEQRFTLNAVLKHITAKLVRRHPHIFGKVKLKTSEEVLKQWNMIKQEEKEHLPHHSILDGIPKNLPALAKAQKMAKRLAVSHYKPEKKEITSQSLEDQIGEDLWKSVQRITQTGIDAEQALRKKLSEIEAEFREWESKQGDSQGE